MSVWQALEAEHDDLKQKRRQETEAILRNGRDALDSNISSPLDPAREEIMLLRLMMAAATSLDDSEDLPELVATSE